MDVVTMLSLCLIFCGKDHAKDLNPTTIVHGNNATVYIDISKTDGKTLLEINFSGYTSNQHFTNVVLYMPVKGQKGNISINSNYTGRIESVVNNNGHFSFLLLNVMFNDSGNYTVKENSNVNGYTSVLVARHIFVARLGEPITLSFILYENNTPSVRVDNPNSRVSQPVVMYNSTNDSCTYTNFGSGENKNIHNCMLRKGEFSFSFPEIEWLHKGSYFAWNDKGRLLDSLFLDIQDNNLTGHVAPPRSSDIDKETWLIITVLVITIFAACLVVVGVWKLRIRIARMSMMHSFFYRNGIQTIVYRSSSAFIPEETRTVSTKNNSKDRTELKRNKFQARVKLNDQNLCVRGLGCAKSSGNTRCNLHIDSSLSSAETIQSESAHGYDYIHEYDELSSACQSKQPYIRSKLLDTKSIGSTSQSSFEYSYVVQRRFMTLRPPAPDPVVKKKNKQQNIVADSFYSYKKVDKRSLPRHDPSILFAKKNSQRTMESHRTRSSDELSLDFVNVISPPSFVQLEKPFAKKAANLPQKNRKVKCLNSKVFACRPEPTRFRDSKSRSASQCLSADYPRDDYDHAYAMERIHRRSWSNDDLYGDRSFNTKDPRSRMFSASSCMNEDCYDYLSNSSFNT